MAVLVQFEVGDPQHAFAGVVRRRAAKDRVHASQQFLDAERLDDVVVGAGAQTADAVGRRIARGQEDHRHLRAGRAQVVQHAEAVEAGHHHVEHDQVRVVLGDRHQGRRAVVGGDRLEAVEAQRGRDEVGDVVLVVDDEDPALGCR